MGAADHERASEWLRIPCIDRWITTRLCISVLYGPHGFCLLRAIIIQLTRDRMNTT